MPNHAAQPQTCSERPALRRTRRRLMFSAVLLIVGGTAACAPSSRVDVVRTGLTPATSAQAYVMAQAEETTPEARKAAQAVERQLDAIGWINRSSAPDLKVETAYVVRASSVGATKEDEAWLVQPHRRPWWERKSTIHALSVRLVQPATGQEIGRATAHLHLIGAINDSLMDSLASAAVRKMVEGEAGSDL